MLKNFLLLLFIFNLEFAFSKENKDLPKSKTICLNMIVKNEKAVIKRCLESVKDIIDYWVIVDTGSTDGTQKIIKEYLKGIPGKLCERPWVNFSHNRNEALELAKGKADYLLFIDADELLVFSGSFTKSTLDKDMYVARVQQQTEVESKRTLLINSHLQGWKWQSVLHEYVANPQVKCSELMEELKIFTPQDGFRSQDPLKYVRDAEILEEELKKDPENARYVFYLAQSYLNAKEQTLALINYEKRVSMNQDDTAEIYWSLLKIGEIQERLHFPSETIIDSYCKAYNSMPTQAEPLLRLASFFTSRQNYILGYSIAKTGLSISPSRVFVFTMPWIYDYGFQSIISECCFNMQKYEEAYQILEGTLKNSLPPEIEKKIYHNLSTIKSKMGKQ